MRNNKTFDKRLWTLGILLLTLAVGILVGTVLAYYSDSIEGIETSIVGALEMDAKKTVRKYYTKSDGTQAADMLSFETDGITVPIADFKPGEIIEITMNLRNIGTKSAWVRDMYSFTIKKIDGTAFIEEGAFVLYKSSYALNLDDIRNNTALNPIKATAAGISKTYTKPVIYNGSSLNKVKNEITGGIDTDDKPQVVRYYLYFNKDASTNDDVTIVLSLKTEAVQFKNNTKVEDVDWSKAEVLSTDVVLQ